MAPRILPRAERVGEDLRGETPPSGCCSPRRHTSSSSRASRLPPPSLLEQGEVDAASALYDDLGLQGPIPEHIATIVLRFARGLVRIAQGRDEEGLADLRELTRHQDESKRAFPALSFPGSSDP